MLDENFCPSPWFHMRINNTGNYEYCRWATKQDRQDSPSISTTSPIQWFQKDLADLRNKLLDGQEIRGCRECREMERHKKVSGRQRQLLKTGVDLKKFEKTLLSSTWLPAFQHSQENQGITDQWPQDWQIDLGNFCNSACVFCTPYSSSRLANEFKRLGIISKTPPNTWCDDPGQLNSFIDIIKKSPKLAYLHFIGGETLITPAFRDILQALIDCDISSNVTIGFTTNLTVWDNDILEMLSKFQQVNLGMSIECLHPLNDYVRYGGKLDKTIEILHKWIETGRQLNWLMQLRITPTVLSIWHLDTIYRFALDHEIAIESCNFLESPEFMRPSVLPKEYRTRTIEKMKSLIDTIDGCPQEQIVNTRDPNNARHQILQDVQSYVNYLEQQDYETYRLPDLVAYLKKLESSRNNSILNYLPEYENLLRSAGY